MAESDKSESVENFVLIINCSKCLSSEEFITQITKDKFLTQTSSDGFTYHSWKIQNKYYSAEVRFIVVTSKDGKSDWLDKIELQATGIVILFDQNQLSFDKTKEWLSYVESHDASTVLLVGSETTETSAVLKSQILKFSLKHSFEFIDLSEKVDTEDDFPDTVGFARIGQALEATEWPNLQMKGKIRTTNVNKTNCHRKTETSENKPLSTAEDVGSQTNFNTLHDIPHDITDEPELDGESSFDKLFSQMRLMKEKAENLPPTERKAYAEQVAVAFWRAIGGEDDEIVDLDAL